MATYKGTEGVLLFGDAGWSESAGWQPGNDTLPGYLADEQYDLGPVELTAFAITLTATVISDNSTGDEWDTHLPGRNAMTGSVSWNYDYEEGTGGITDLTRQLHAKYVGRQIQFDVYPQGFTRGPLVGAGTITSVEIQNNHDNTVCTLTAQITGTGEWTEI